MGQALGLSRGFSAAVTSVIDNIRLAAPHAAPTDGIPAGDVTFTVTVNGSTQFTVNLPQTVTRDNMTLSDLAADATYALLEATTESNPSMYMGQLEVIADEDLARLWPDPLDAPRTHRVGSRPATASASRDAGAGRPAASAPARARNWSGDRKRL